ncbi:MAG: hypothetical protein SCALA702_25320 [Melioribacteraceae bacterium]|nr:MAG: hypothetical protein SCALA702_25320 [Melioribacteraceae bacterium]
MSDKYFFQNLPEVDDYLQVANLSKYKKAPSGWYIVLTDIHGSTKAIESGKYKEVNIVGASVIVALTNLCKPLEIPYVFGGDGATLLIPPEYLSEVEKVLDSTRKMARKSFNFDLRCAIIPVAEINALGKSIFVSKYKVSTQYSNAVFSGGGIDLAEQLLKDENRSKQYAVKVFESSDNRADFSGLECRWDNVFPDTGKIVALLIKVSAKHNDNQSEIYAEVISALNKITPDILKKKPFNKKNLGFTLSWKKLNLENKIHVFGSKMKSFTYRLKIYGQILLGIVMMHYNIKTGDFEWGDYKIDLVNNTDSKKFDEMIRMVINLDDNQIEDMIKILEKYKDEGKIVYGYNISGSAILTCVVQRRKDKHFHLVDAADGGYALAAKMLKGML